MEYAQFFSHLRICSYINCNNIACDDYSCERHGGVRHQCNGIKRNGTRCTNKCNDNGDKCGVHGGLSKPAINEIVRVLRLRSVDRNRPHFDIVLRFMQYRIALANTVHNSENVNSSIELISKFNKVSISDDCAICLSEVEDGVEHPCCKKVSCSDCMKKWVECSSSCPYCRTVLS